MNETKIKQQTGFKGCLVARKGKQTHNLRHTCKDLQLQTCDSCAKEAFNCDYELSYECIWNDMKYYEKMNKQQ